MFSRVEKSAAFFRGAMATVDNVWVALAGVESVGLRQRSTCCRLTQDTI